MNEQDKGRLIEQKIQEVKDRKRTKEDVNIFFTAFAATTDFEGRKKLVSETDPFIVTCAMLHTMDMAEDVYTTVMKVDNMVKDGLGVNMKGIVDPNESDKRGVEIKVDIPQNEEAPTLQSCCVLHALEELVERCVVVDDPEKVQSYLNGLAAATAGKGTVH